MLRDELMQFIRSSLIGDPSADLDVEESLIDRGLLDSIGLIRIMTFLETNAGVRVPDSMVTPDHFGSVTSIERMVNGLKERVG